MNVNNSAIQSNLINRTPNTGTTPFVQSSKAASLANVQHQTADQPLAKANTLTSPLSLSNDQIDSIAKLALSTTPSDPAEAKEKFLAGLEAAWGSDDKTYDLNADGTVDVQDLMKFLAEWDTQAASGDANVADVTIQSAVEPGTSTDNEAPAATTPLEDFMAAWGTDNTEFDLNGDGTVNTVDLVAFLADQAAAAGSAPEAEHGTDPYLQGLMDAFGTDNAEFDLNSDGIVDVQDLTAYLASVATGRQTLDNPAAAIADAESQIGKVKPTNDAPLTAAASTSATEPHTSPIQDSNETQQTLADRFMERWGESDPNFDQNGDGTVDTQDLLAWLAGQSGASDQGTSILQDFNSQFQQPNFVQQAQVDNIANTLIASLQDAGFTNQPPANIQTLLDAMDLTNEDRNEIKSKMNQQYPNGLGINVSA